MYLVGVDEVGRGAVGGPVVAAATTVQSSKCKVQNDVSIFIDFPGVHRGNGKKEILLPVLHRHQDDMERLRKLGVRDSKELTPKRREELEPKIIKIVDGFGIGEASVEEINKLGIVKATWLAMKRAVEGLGIKPDVILVDGREIPKLSANSDQLSVVRGDKLIPLISAASIIAKVYRDRLMVEKYHREYPNYGLAQHKGYGTKLHLEKIREFGLSPIHRGLFCGTLITRARETPITRF